MTIVKEDTDPTDAGATVAPNYRLTNPAEFVYYHVYIDTNMGRCPWQSSQGRLSVGVSSAQINGDLESFTVRLMHFKQTFVVTIIPVLFLGLIATPEPGAQEQTLGLFVKDSLSYSGYTLFAPIMSTTTYLIDHYGRVVHTWPSNYPPGMLAYLLDDGTLLRPGRLGGAGGAAGKIQMIDWDGAVTWDFNYNDDQALQHHDVEAMPNGNILLLAWEFKTAQEAIDAGRIPDSLLDAELWPEHVVEVQPTGFSTGDIVWEWHLWDHLIQDYDSTKDNYGVVANHPELVDINYMEGGQDDWIHANSIDYNPDLDQIVISCRQFSEIWVIDHSTKTAEAAGHSGGNAGMGGDIIYRWGNPRAYRAGDTTDQQLFQQHDAHWIPPGHPGEGNILIFNNGTDIGYSSVDEIVTPVTPDGRYPVPLPGNPHGPDAPVWRYLSEPVTDFFAIFISGAKRMPNGNTLICSGPRGHLFEVTTDSQIVWEYVNPITASGPLTQGDPVVGNLIFQSSRYAANHPGLMGRDLTPGGPLEIYPVSVSGTRHMPSEPGVNNSVVLTTSLSSAIGIADASVYVDTGDGYFPMVLYDDGLHHDSLPDDDFYGAAIPPLPESTLVHYYVSVTDDTGAVTTDPPNPPATAYSYRVCYQPPKIFINEIMVLNENCCTDDFGEYDSWIELYNAESYAVDLSQMFLTDDLDRTTRFIITDTVIPAGGYIVFWADRQKIQGYTHTNFILSASGGEVGLFDAVSRGNYLVDAAAYDGQIVDVSYGRIPDGHARWSLLADHSILASNGEFECGNVDGLVGPGGPVDVSDLTYFVDYLFRGGPLPPVLLAANVNGQSGPGGPLDIADLTYLVDFLFKGGPEPACE